MARTGRPRTPVDVDAIRTLTLAGWRMQKIADHLGVSRNVIWGAMKREGIPRHDQHSLPGEANPAWKGGRQVDDDGYILIYAPDHPNATKHGYVREHRLVMEASLGRLLLRSEVVHHIDGVKSNNDISNLRLYSRNSDHLRDTLMGHVPCWTDSGKERIRIALATAPHLPASAETRRKMSETRKGRPGQPKSPETREKIRQAAILRGGRPHSAESIEKIRRAAIQRATMKHVAIPPSSETDDGR